MSDLSKKDAVKSRVRTLIKEGVYLPGSKLPSDTELHEEFDASKVTVVRALKELEAEGYVYRRRGSGTYIRQHRMAPIVEGKKFRIAIAWFTRVFPGKLRDDALGVITRSMLKELGLNNLKPKWADKSEHDQQTWAQWDAGDSPVCVDVLGPSADCLERHPPLELIKEGAYDAVVCVSLDHEPWLSDLLKLKIPVIIVDFMSRQFDLKADQVFYDSVSAYQEVVHHLINKGCTNIHFVGGLVHPQLESREGLSVEDAKRKRFDKKNKMIEPDSYFRLSAFKQIMEEMGRIVNEKMIHYTFLGSQDTDTFAETMATRKDAPDAFICHSATQAESIRKAFRKQKKKVLAIGAGQKGKASALSILDDNVQLGQVAGAILISRLKQPGRIPLRVGVPLQFKSK